MFSRRRLPKSRSVKADFQVTPVLFTFYFYCYSAYAGTLTKVSAPIRSACPPRFSLVSKVTLTVCQYPLQDLHFCLKALQGPTKRPPNTPLWFKFSNEIHVSIRVVYSSKNSLPSLQSKLLNLPPKFDIQFITQTTPGVQSSITASLTHPIVLFTSVCPVHSCPHQPLHHMPSGGSVHVTMVMIANSWARHTSVAPII